MRGRAGQLRRPIGGGDEAVASAVGTVLLVVITVALVSVVGLFLFALFSQPEEPPELRVNFVKLNSRWSISISSSSDEVPLDSLRIIAEGTNGELITYDSDGDGIRDSAMVDELDHVAVEYGDGPQTSPIVYVDADGDGKTSVGDSIVVFELFYPPARPLLDADRGYRIVGPSPDAIPRDSTMLVVGSRVTLGSNDIDPGDGMQVRIKCGATTYALVTGNASAGGVFERTVDVGAGWPKGAYDAIFTIRPGQVDEWSYTYSFRVISSDPITSTEAEAYYDSSHPFVVGDVVRVVHKPSNSVILEFTL
jgi:FlaG/FlaF family flagellin (archaellin)